MNVPLAERMRPKNLEEYIGQAHLVGDGQALRIAIQNRKLHSMIFWGPPGVGKTTLARILAKSADIPFTALSAISAGVKEVRAVIQTAKKAGQMVLFIDEIHRFNKSQQDALLGAVENGIIILIGATTENPSFEVISALLSRCQVYVLKPFTGRELLTLLENVISNDEQLQQYDIVIKEHEALLQLSGADARKLLNLLEITIDSIPDHKKVITNKVVEKAIQQNTARYDKSGEQHYDIISAFIKSIRGSDPNAAVYWLARMIDGGEDPKFIARRLLILASEDIGNANPTALVLANSCFQATNTIGYPECRIILSQATIYLACSPKSNASYQAINKALDLSKKTQNLGVPLEIRNAPTQLMKELNYGKNYQYAHAYEGNFSDMEFLPDKIKGVTLYEPGNNVRENEFKKRLKNWWGEKYGY